MSWEIFAEAVKQYGIWFALFAVACWAFITEIVVPGKVRDKEVLAADARAKEWKERCDRWEGTALRLSVLTERSAEAVKEVKDALLGRRDQV